MKAPFRVPAGALVMLACVALAGCGPIKFSQLETAKRITQPLVQPLVGAVTPGEATASPELLAQYEWRFIFNDTEFAVYPVAQQGRRTIFANADGLKLTWDGESLIIIEGMPGAFGYYEQGIEPGSVNPSGSRRWFARAGWPVLYLDCVPPRDWRLTSDRYGWRQECEGELEGVRVRSMHSVERDRAGNIREIQATLWPTVRPMRLRRLRD
jgi:hypothetical protein